VSRKRENNTTRNQGENSKHKCACAPGFCIHVSFACNQQLTRRHATIVGSKMQSGPLGTRNENHMPISKTQYNTKSVTNFGHECALVCGIHVNFACNQQLASCRVIITGSVMQSGASVTRTRKLEANFKNAIRNTARNR
jgi:hypothetical protein